MRKKTAYVAAGLLLLLGARSVAWPGLATAVTATPRVLTLGDPAHDWISVRIEWQPGPALRRWLGLFLEREGR